MKYIKIIFVLISMFFGGGAWAHSNGENYSFINIQEKTIDGHFELNLINLRNDLHIAIDADNTLESLKQSAALVQSHILENYAIYGYGEKLDIQFTTVELFGKSERGYAKYFFVVDVGLMPDELVFENSLFFDNNLFHRGLLLVDFNYKTQKKYKSESTALIFSPDNFRQTLDLNDIPQLLKRKEFIWQGMVHILIGYDHILFLVVLLLTAVLSREGGQWKVVDSFRTVLLNFVKVVTLFTVAHSITLTLAALGIVKVHSQLVESMIALSIVLVALNNIIPVFNDRKWMIILVFGLFHGLGFATVMAQLPFRMGDLIYVMLFFNIGVELGQLAIVAVLLPFLFYLSRYEKVYVTWVLTFASVAIGLMAFFWLVQRGF